MQPQGLQAAGEAMPLQGGQPLKAAPCISLAAGELTDGSSRAAVGAEANSAPCWLREPAGSSGSRRPRDWS